MYMLEGPCWVRFRIRGKPPCESLGALRGDDRGTNYKESEQQMSEAAVWSADVRAFGSTPTTGAEAGAAPVEPRRDRDDGERKSAWCVRMRYLLTEHIEGCGNPVATIVCTLKITRQDV